MAGQYDRRFSAGEIFWGGKFSGRPIFWARGFSGRPIFWADFLGMGSNPTPDQNPKMAAKIAPEKIRRDRSAMTAAEKIARRRRRRARQKSMSARPGPTGAPGAFDLNMAWPSICGRERWGRVLVMQGEGAKKRRL